MQTIWPALYSRRTLNGLPSYRRERWITPDNDFVDADWLNGSAAPGAPLLVLFHGLEGSSRSHYSEAFADYADRSGLAFVVPHFRGCSGEINHGPRAYHSGDFEEIGWILQRLRQSHSGPIVAVGVSLGGNALLRWAEEMGHSASSIVNSVAAISSPIDLAAGGAAIGRGFNRLVYTRMFLHTMKPKALKKLEQHPGLFSRDALQSARNLYEFDNAFTAPVHGFKNTDDYWKRGSSKSLLHQIRVPALVINARNDPFLPSSCLPEQSEVGAYVKLWQPEHGGHAGFAQGKIPGHVQTLPTIVVDWLVSKCASNAERLNG